MPLVTITLRPVFSEREQREITQAIHSSLVEEMSISDGDFNHRILELDERHWHLPAGRSDRFVCVEIRMYPGRTVDMKRALYRSIVKKLQSIGVPSGDVLVVLDEPPKENWSVAFAAP
jgi:phenylpyruvate tautomerase PptA (4-oxalocrotonate tautomerase family)